MDKKIPWWKKDTKDVPEIVGAIAVLIDFYFAARLIASFAWFSNLYFKACIVFIICGWLGRKYISKYWDRSSRPKDCKSVSTMLKIFMYVGAAGFAATGVGLVVVLGMLLFSWNNRVR